MCCCWIETFVDTRCGAVKATIDLVDQGKTALEATGCENLDSVVEVITDSVKSETDTKENRTSSNEAFVDRVAEINVVQTMQTIYQNSPTLRRLIDEEKVMIVGGIYDVKSGKVTFIDKPVLSIV